MNMQEQLVIPFFCPEIEKAGNRRRTRTVASSDAAITPAVTGSKSGTVS